MPIKSNFTDSVQTISFTPFRLPENTLLIENIEEMFSYDLQVPEQPVEIDYTIGSTDVYSFDLFVKNLTRNATLTISIEYNKEIFVIENDTIILNPEETKAIKVTLNAQRLDLYVVKTTFSEQVKISVTNIENNTVVYRNAAVTVLSQIPFPTT